MWNLIIDQISPDYVLLHDLGDWVVDDGFMYPDFYFISIKDTKGNSYKEKIFPKNGHVISEHNFKDGVHEFTLDNCGKVFTQSFLLCAELQCSVDVGMIEAENDRDLELLRDIQNDIDVAKLSARSGNYDASNEIIEKAKQKLQNINCNCDCK